MVTWITSIGGQTVTLTGRTFNEAFEAWRVARAAAVRQSTPHVVVLDKATGETSYRYGGPDVIAFYRTSDRFKVVGVGGGAK